MKQISLLTAVCFLSLVATAQQIPSTFWGINHWMPKKYLNNPTQPSGIIEKSQVQQMIKNAGSVFYRIGGNGYDESGTAIGIDSSSNDYIRAMQIIRASNPAAKFLIQVPYKAGTFTPDSARKMVLNIEQAFPFESFYYSIGNEWDRYRNTVTQKLRSVDMANVMRSFAIEMKAADNSIKIVAPSLSFFSAQDSLGQSIMTRLIGGADDITQIITGSGNPFLDNLKYYIDVVNFHSYGGSSGNLSNDTTSTAYNASRNGLLNYAGVANQGFSDELDDLITLINSANASRTGSPLTFAITEMNVCYENQPNPVSGNKYTNSVEGLGARSFFGGQHFADIMSTALQKGTVAGSAKVEFVMPWSVHESGGNGTSTDLGMTKGPGTSAPPIPVSSYHHYQLMAQHFTGKYYASSSNNISPSTKAFCSVVDSAGVYVMILNRDSVQYVYNMDLQGNSPAGKPLLLGFNIPSTAIPLDSAHIFNDTIGANTTLLILYNCHGRKMWKKKYSLSDAQTDGIPHFKQIGERNVDPEMSACETNMFEGEFTSNVTYSNMTLYVTDDVIMKNGAKLTLNNVVAVVSPGVLIKGENNSSIELTNGTVMFGCNGPWKGLELDGSNVSSESIIMEDSYIYNAVVPIKANEVSNISIRRNILANGATGISLDRCGGFVIESNIIGGYAVGVETYDTPASPAKIVLNEFLQVDTAIYLENDDHSQLDLSCNIFNFTEFGVYSNNTLLADIGSPVMSAGNVFQKYGSLAENFIEHTGGTTTYYEGPIENAYYGGSSVMNISKSPALTDQLCAVSILLAHNCKGIILGTRENQKKDDLIVIFPNPSNGTFNLSSNLKGKNTLRVYDVLGKMVLTREWEENSEPINFQITAAGIYVATVSGMHGIESKKIIVE